MKSGEIVSGSSIRNLAIITQQKTGQPMEFELMIDARSSLNAWLEQREGSVEDFAFPSRIDHAHHLSSR